MLSELFKKYFLFACAIFIVVVSFLVFAKFTNTVRAQSLDPWGYGTQQALAATGLGTENPSVIIVNIVRIFLGFLGVIAVIIIMYAGFLWMTAGGNAEQIGKAKKWMINGVIGLAIILSSFAIASFILSRLISATGAGGGGGNPPSPPFPPGPPPFLNCIDPASRAEELCGIGNTECATALSATPYICSISPENGPKGTYVTINGYHFNDYDKDKSKVEFYDKKNNIATPAEIVTCPGNSLANWTDNRIIIKVPDVQAGDYTIRVIDKAEIVNVVDNREAFEVTDGVVPPGIACILPGSGKENAEVIVYGDYFGDTKGDNSNVVFEQEVIANIVDGADWSMKEIKTAVPSGAVRGDVIARVGELKSNGYPFIVICGNNGECASGCCYNYSYCADVSYCQPGPGEDCLGGCGGTCQSGLICGTDCKCGELHPGDACFISPGTECAESGECGGSLVCNKTSCVCENLPAPGEKCYGGCGGSCTLGSICNASCVCEESPVIYWISPDNGAAGNLVTIGGAHFGATQGVGKVEFILGESIIEANLAGAVNALCSSADWADSQIIIEVPKEAEKNIYEIQVITNEAKTSNKKEFTVNNIERPGLCAAYKEVNQVKTNEGEFEDKITLAGVNLQDINNKTEVYFGEGRNDGMWSITTSADGTIISDAGVPSIKVSGDKLGVGIFVQDTGKDNSLRSNPVNFSILKYSSLPVIDGFSPLAGHAGDYVTIYGRDFGATQGHVYFDFGPNNPEANYSFPQECLTGIWSNNQILVKVPEYQYNFNFGKIRIITADSMEAISDKIFFAGDHCSGYDGVGIPCGFETDGTDTCIAEGKGKCITSVKPGLCKISPSNGHDNTEVSFFGENFGAAEISGVRGKAEFNAEVEKDDGGNKVKKAEKVKVEVSNWTNGTAGQADSAKANAPANVRNGLIDIISATGLQSNGINFEYMRCVDNNECASNNICCPMNSYFEGSCMANAMSCGLGAKLPTDYMWSFTTETPPAKNCSVIIDAKECEGNGYCCFDGTSCTNTGCPESLVPKVEEHCDKGQSCNNNSVGPSPSPWKEWPNGESACVDSIIRADFSVGINQDTLTYGASGNIIVKECSAENSCDGAVVAGNVDPSVMGFSFTADNNLTKNTWYQVTLKGDGGIKAVDKDGKVGKFLDGDGNGAPGGDYTWKFKTGDSNIPCEAGCAFVNPAEYTAPDKNLIKYAGNIRAKDNICELLRNKGETWSWASDTLAKAEISSDETCCSDIKDADSDTIYSCAAHNNWTCVLPKAETLGTPVKIKGTVAKKNVYVPLIDAISPESGKSGGIVEIKGINFGATAGNVVFVRDRKVSSGHSYSTEFNNSDFWNLTKGASILVDESINYLKMVDESVASLDFSDSYIYGSWEILGIGFTKLNDEKISFNFVNAQDIGYYFLISQDGLALEKKNANGESIILEENKKTIPINMLLGFTITHNSDGAFKVYMKKKVDDKYKGDELVISVNDNEILAFERFVILGAKNNEFFIDSFKFTPIDITLPSQSFPANLAGSVSDTGCSGKDWNDTRILAEVPAGVDSNSDYNLIVTNSEGLTVAKEFTVNTAGISFPDSCNFADYSGTAHYVDVFDSGDLYIDFSDFSVEEFWPNCNESCLNAEVGARFSGEIDAAISLVDKLFLYKCETAKADGTGCAAYSATATTTTKSVINISDNGKTKGKVLFSADNYFALNTWYRAVIKGGAAGLKNVDGGGIDNVNFDSDGDKANDAFFWEFKTGVKECAVDSVSVEPAYGIVGQIGAGLMYISVPRAKADICNGQKLNAFSYDWDFSAPAGSFASISNYPTCGNGIIEKGEDCDRGIDKNGKDGFCSSDCLNSGNSIKCGTLASGCCGNGTEDANEECDGEVWCSDKCLRKGSNVSYNSFCGNGKIEAGEDCDGEAGCDLNICVWRGTVKCNATLTTGCCGNGTKDAGEECDGEVGCSDKCLRKGTAKCSGNCCGNGKIDVGEDCDPSVRGLDADSDADWVQMGCGASCLNTGRNACTADNKINCCGNKIVETGEDCDEAYGCSSSCLHTGTVTGVAATSTPYQLVTAVSGPTALGQTSATTDITAKEVLSSISGIGKFTIQCGYTDESKCPAGMGIGTNSCCYARPVVISPVANITNFCPNGAVEIVFNQIMDKDILEKAKILEKKNDGSGCGAVLGEMVERGKKVEEGEDGNKLEIRNWKLEISNLVKEINNFFLDLFIGNRLISAFDNFKTTLFGMALNTGSVDLEFSAVIHNVSIAYKKNMSMFLIKPKAVQVDSTGLEPVFPQVDNRGARQLAELPISPELLNNNYSIIDYLLEFSKNAVIGSFNNVKIHLADLFNSVKAEGAWCPVGQKISLRTNAIEIPAVLSGKAFEYTFENGEDLKNVTLEQFNNSSTEIVDVEGDKKVKVINSGMIIINTGEYSYGAWEMDLTHGNNLEAINLAVARSVAQGGQYIFRIEIYDKLIKLINEPKSTIVSSSNVDFKKEDLLHIKIVYAKNGDFLIDINDKRIITLNNVMKEKMNMLTLGFYDSGDNNNIIYVDNIKFTPIVLIEAVPANSGTAAIITPSELLDSNSEYRLNFDGLKNIYGVAIANTADADKITVSAKEEICLIDHIDVLIDNTSPIATTTDDIFICAGRNDCGSATTELLKDDDADSATAGNQHLYRAYALDKEENLLSANYFFKKYDPSSAIQIEAILSGQTGQQRYVTSKSIERADATITVGGASEYGAATTTVNVMIFMCENPWPSIKDFPYTDMDYNFSSFYCKDKKPAQLPGLGNVLPICKGANCNTGILKEYLWVEE